MIEILIPFIAFWFARVTGIPQRIKLTNRKPFACAKCMGMWLALTHQIYIGFHYESIAIIAISSLMAWVIEMFALRINLRLN
jgi:hypothetical protein